MLDLVSLAGAWREVADAHVEPRGVGEACLVNGIGATSGGLN
jgi:hypothetical protein